MGWLLGIPGIGKIVAALGAAAAVLGGLFLFGRSKKKQGVAEERAKTTEKVLENVEKAKRVGDKPLSESDRRKLSKKYGRK